MERKDTTYSSYLPQPPEEVLCRERPAPKRYEEEDVYFAKETHERSQILPDSNLLKALHFYISEYYSKAIPEDQVKPWRSLDETALLALGILVEEASRELTGPTGDLPFVTGERGNEIITWDGKEFSRSVLTRQKGKSKRT